MEVQLGEYHTVNDTDCVFEKGIQECSDPVRDYTVNKTIIHRYYTKRTRKNDIALIRLNGRITYSDYIRPICLPLPGTKFANIGDTMTISGWGIVNYKGTSATIKKRILAELISNEDCRERTKSFVREVTDDMLCTVTFNNSNEQSCSGDGGGPVMVSNKLQWHQEGIVSFGIFICGSKYPEIHTRVEKYLEWIEENTEP
ncbi:hypothetical protein ILUMI_19868 [Ignelater luminosus]|uniref:Peptidase S1 domain-containing protein n=1 Tax=Ignelater luminosus TaxID=2038154 RepID=A0A8K0FZG7_IGNLU|nr:hypothetical protein ILUMI_19868 [Ignelater luminosus]